MRRPLDRSFKPHMTIEDFRERFSLLDPHETLEKFFNHHIANGDTAANWHEKFLSFAARGQKMAEREREQYGVQTDSMGLPVDAGLRRRMNGESAEIREERRRLIVELQQRQRGIEERAT